MAPEALQVTFVPPRMDVTRTSQGRQELDRKRKQRFQKAKCLSHADFHSSFKLKKAKFLVGGHNLDEIQSFLIGPKSQVDFILSISHIVFINYCIVGLNGLIFVMYTLTQ